MEIEDAITFTDTLVFARAGVHLSDLQQAMLRASWSWQRQSYDQIADTYGYSPTYLKHDVGPKLWRLLSEVLGEKVNKTSFRAAIERRFYAEATAQEQTAIAGLNSAGESGPHLSRAWELSSPGSSSQFATAAVAQLSLPHRQDWGEAVDVQFFYGRQQELAQLQHWILNEQCRWIALLGIGGMGKTSLSVKLAQQLQTQFEWVIWRSLRTAPPLADLLNELLQRLSTTADYTDTVEGKITRLVQALRSHRCLIVLDNLETILQDGAPNTYCAGCEGYGILFKQIGETVHQSCLVVTSREKPPEMSLLEGETLPVRSLHLGGLHQSEGRILLGLKGTFQGSEQDWQQLIEGYSGNPLALKVISTTIQNLFGGNIAAFLQQEALVFGNIRSLIEQQFERLSNPEKTVMYALAIDREPTSFAAIRTAIFPSFSPQRLMEILESLEQRSLIEKSESRFSLQPVVMEYVTERLIEQVCQEIRTGFQLTMPQAEALLKQHALLKAQAKDYVRENQIRLILQPVLDRLLMNWDSHTTLEENLMQRLGEQRGRSRLEVGYIGGNLLNLLCQHQRELSGCDFSNLILWQADLQAVRLHDVNLAQADLSQSMFTETLGIVFAVAFSPDGQLLATGDAEGGLRLWQAADSKPLLNLEGHRGWVWAIAFSPDGQRLASCSNDKTIRVWDVRTGQCLHTLKGHTSGIWTVAFSADGQRLASGGDEPIVRLWDIEQGTCRQVLIGHTDAILSIAFCANSQLLASGSADRTIRLWQAQTGEALQVWEGHTNRVWSVAFSPDSDLLASGSADRTVKIWDIATGQCQKTLQEHGDRVRAVRFSANGMLLASSSDDQTVRIWSVATGQCLNTLLGHRNTIFTIDLAADQQTLASGSADQTVKLWNLQTGRCLSTLKGYTNSVFSVAFSPDGALLASSSTDQTVRLWHPETGACLHTLLGHTGWVTSVVFHPQGHLLASSSVDQTVRLWSVNQGQCLKIFQGHTNWVQSVAFSPGGDVLASCGDDRTIRLWSISSGKCLQTLEGHTNWVWSVRFSPDGTLLATCSDDQTLRLWSVRTGDCLHVLQGHTNRIQAIAFSPDGQWLSSASIDETVRLWDVQTGDCVRVLRGHENNVWTVAFSPDGMILASGSLDQTIRLWDMATGDCVRVLPVLTHSVRTAIAFHPISAVDPQRLVLASGSHNGAIKLWDAITGQCLTTLISDLPYKDTNITQAIGLTAAQKAALKALGAIEEE